MSATDDQMRLIREAVNKQLGVERPQHLEIRPQDCERFAPDLPDTLTSERSAELLARADELQPWLQGPFWIGGDIVVGGTWRNDYRWVGLGPKVPADMSGMRVLDVGSNAGYDPFMFHKRGAEYVLACEPFQFIEQARFLEDIYRTGVDFQPLMWQQLDVEVHGTFDFIHCHGVLYHEQGPVGLVERLRSLLRPGGTMFFGSMMLGDPELAEYARFIPGAYYRDPTWWWVPGRLTMRWMLEAAGLEVFEEFGQHDGPPGEFDVVNAYFRAQAPC